MAVQSLLYIIKNQPTKKSNPKNPQTNQRNKYTFFFFLIAFTANRRVLLSV